MIVLDTHAVVWWANDPKALGRRAHAAVTGADRLGIPAIVFWEVSLLTRRRKLDLGMTVQEWAARICAVPRVVPLPLTVDVALLADTLAMHADPADRFIVAAALHTRSPLVTKDTLLRSLRVVQTIW